MSWLGNGISNITGQISNFTREVLTEGTEEIDDAATELRISTGKLQQWEQICTNQKTELDRVKHAYDELAEKLESSELQNNALSTQYRTVLDQKERQLCELQEQLTNAQSHHEHEHEHQHHNGRASTGASSNIRLQQLEADNVHLQQQVRQLTGEVTATAGRSGGEQTAEGDHSNDATAEIAKLNACIKALKQQVSEEGKQHEDSQAATHQLHAQKLAQLKRRHRDDLRNYDDQISQLQDLLDIEGDEASVVHAQQLQSMHATARQQEEHVYKLTVDLEQTHAADRHKAQQLETVRKQYEEATLQVAKLSSELSSVQEKYTSILGELDDVNAEHQAALMKQALHKHQQPVSSTPYKPQTPPPNINLDNVDGGDEQWQRQVESLTEQVANYQKEVAHWELVQADWQTEKAAIEDLMVSLRTELRQKEEALTLADAREKQNQQKSPAKSSRRRKKKGLRVAQQLQEEEDNAMEAEERDDMDEDDDDIEEELEELQDKVNLLTEGSAQMENERDILEAETKLLHQKNNDLSAANEKLTQELMELKAPGTEQPSQVKELAAQLAEKEAELLNTSALLVNKEEQTQGAVDEVRAKEAEVAELMTSMEELDTQHQEAMTQMILTRKQLQQSNQKLEQANAQLQEELQSVKETAAKEGEANVGKLQEEVQKLHSEIEKLQQENVKHSEGLQEVEVGKKDIERLLGEVSAFGKEKESLEKEIEELKGKNEKAAMVLNDLHMDKQEFESRVKDLKTEMERLKDEAKDALKGKKDAEEKLRVFEENGFKEKEVTEEKEGDENEEAIQEMKLKLLSMESRCAELEGKLAEALRSNDESSQKFTAEITNLTTQIDALQDQKASLEKEVGQLEQKLHDQGKHYQSYVRDLENARDLNESGLQQEHEKLMKQCHEKDMQIERLQEDAERVQGSLDDTKDMLHSAIDDQQGIGDMLSEKENEITTLRRSKMNLEEEVETQSMTIKGHEAELARLAEIEQQYKLNLEERKKLKTQIESLQSRVHQLESKEQTEQIETRTLDIITDLEEEITGLKKTIERKDIHIDEQKKTISALKETVVEREESMVELNSRNFKEVETVKSSEAKIEEQQSLIDELQNVIAQKDAEKTEEMPQSQGSGRDDVKKDNLIVELQEKLSCLQQMLDVQTAQSREELKTLRMEKDQMMSILTEKSRECSQLKSEVHRLMNIVSAEKTALSKLQQDNSELRQKQEAPNNDMTKEAVKKLSAMIRDKEMEIEALTQKNTSLLQVLQESGQQGSVLANLIQERDNLHKQVGLFQNDREQIIQALNAKHSESLMYHGEVQRLTALINTETEKKDKLQQEYSNLVQQYEDKQQVLLNVQNELLNYKQRLIEVDHQYKEVLQQQEMQRSQSSTGSGEREEEEQEMEGSKDRGVKDEHLEELVERERHLQQQVKSLQQQVKTLQERLQAKKAADVKPVEVKVTEVKEVIDNEVHQVTEIQETKSSMSSQPVQNNACDEHYEEIESLKSIISSHEVAFAEKDRQISENERVLTNKEAALSKSAEAINQKDKMLNEKDKGFSELTVRFHKTEQMLRTRDSEIGSLTKQVEKLGFRLSGIESELKDVRAERDQLHERIPMLEQDSMMLKEANNKLSMSVNDKDFEINALKEKSNTLGKLLSDKRSLGEEKGEMDRLMKETETLHQQAQAFKQDRDQFILALQQQQGENSELKQQYAKLQEEKQKLVREVSRLREHLLQVEEGYTREALEAEDREKDLRTRLATAEERALAASTSVQNASVESSRQFDSLRTEIHSACEQRDSALHQLAAAQEQAAQYASSLQNLQMVLEQFQLEKEAQQAAEIERCEREIYKLRQENVAVVGEMRSLQAQLEESTVAVEAAQRLSDQLDKKEELISALREEVQSRELQMKALEEEIASLASATEAKVEKALMKNLLLGYFHTPARKKEEALQIIAHVLDMTASEIDDLGQEVKGRGWLGGLWGAAQKTPPTTPLRGRTKPGDTSFSELFIKYLERESTPTPEVHFNAERMVQEQQAKKPPAFNPFSVPIPTSSSAGTSLPSSSHQQAGLGGIQAAAATGTRPDQFLLSSTSTAAAPTPAQPLPVFPSSHILKEVLQ